MSVSGLASDQGVVHIQPWTRGQRQLPVRDQNTVFDFIRGAHGQRSRAGLALTGQPLSREVLVDVGMVVAEGPGGIPEHPGNAYWVSRAEPTDAVIGNHLGQQVQFSPRTEQADIVLTVNIREHPESHRLPIGTTVILFSMPNRRGKLRYFIDVTPTDPEFVQIIAFSFLGDNRWKYTGIVVITDPGDPTSWIAAPSPSGPGFILINDILNTVEAGNLADPSIRGNSVDSGGPSYPPGFILQPIRGNPILPLYRARGSARYVTYENADDGPCQ